MYTDYMVLAAATLLTLVIFLRQLLTSTTAKDVRPQCVSEGNTSGCWDYEALKQFIQTEGIHLPAMFVDLDTLERNTTQISEMVRSSGKTLRIATKSTRNPHLLDKILDIGQGVFKGLMCYSVEEAAFLAQRQLDDLFIPYPTFQPGDVHLALQLTQDGTKITLAVDSVEHVKKLDKICQSWNEGSKSKRKSLRVAVDLDMSFNVWFARVGASRSRLNNIQKFADVVRAIRESDHLVLVGAMGYEAHVSGLPDTSPHSSLPNMLMWLVKGLFYRSASKFRQEVADYCKKNDVMLEFFNGGGTGNLRQVSGDPALTEVTAGSGFLQAQFFDYFASNELSPALCFALQTTRVTPEYICCQSGGFVASGDTSVDKFPTPFSNPLRLGHYDSQGYGEVQTPMQIKGRTEMKGDITLGDPVFFRPAKSGEISEHFNHYYVIRREPCGKVQLVDTCKTYRGFGKVFY